MSQERQNHPVAPGRRRNGLWSALAWALAGAGVTAFLFVDPLHLHSPGPPESQVEAPQESEPQTLWTCSMHPHILEDVPGRCPICSMDLVPVRHGAATGTGTAELPARDAEERPLFYRHPMDPGVTSPLPAKDNMGMDYLPVYPSDVEDRNDRAVTVAIDPMVVQNMNVRRQAVKRRDLRRRMRAVGYLEYDQERMVTVTTKYSGFVEKVYVNYIGEPVEKGQPLFDVYSPELVQTAQELLSALELARRLQDASPDTRRRAEALADAARTRLGYWDISQDQIRGLEATGEVFRTLTVTAPARGVVMKRMRGLEGMAVEPGMQTYHIADLSNLWLSVELFEDQVAWVRPGMPAQVTLTYFPGETFRGKVAFLEPAFSEQTRTLKVKIEVPNSRSRLRSGMFATVLFEPVAVPQALAVPSMAVLRTGRRDVVVVEVGPGRFSPREVVLGHEGESWVEVREGLEEGDVVVTSAQFLFDSESSLQEAIQKMIAQQSHRGAG